jgi:hypothetical protein
MRKATTGGLRTRDWVGTVAGFLLVLGTLVVLDPRVAHRLSHLTSRGPGGSELRGVADQAGSLGSALLMAVKDQSLDHAPMLVFTVVALLLVGFMLRT